MKNLTGINLLLILLFAGPLVATAQTSKPSPRFNHVAIFVKDLKVTRAFYENIVGLDTIPEPFHDGKHTWYSLGPGISLHVIEGAIEKKSYYKNQHTCLSVSSVETFVGVLRKNNIVFEDLKGTKNAISSRVDGVKQIWLQDPDGYWIEINDARD